MRRPSLNTPPLQQEKNMSKHYSTKHYGHNIGLSAVFRQPNADHSHCHLLHGYSLQLKFTFGCDELDNKNWAVDFGGLKPLKKWLEDHFDHKTALDINDPHLEKFRELEAFAQFASDLDEATRKQLERGQRATELMKQKQYSPLSVSEMALSLFAVNEGYLDDVEVAKISDYESALHDYARSNESELLENINKTGDYNDDIEASMKKICDDFAKNGSY